MSHISSSLKEAVATRQGVTQTSEHCPRRAYVELYVPLDVKAVRVVTFMTVSRDQGWADTPGDSQTWYEVWLHRPPGRRNSRGIELHHNRGGNPEFNTVTAIWDAHDPSCRPQRRKWVLELRPGDVIQMVPIARYPGWINIIQEASIKIKYEPIIPGTEPQSLQSLVQQNSNHYRRRLQDAPPGTIRLLVVQPGAFQDPIRSRFEYVAIADEPEQQPEFDAMSYVWGDQSDRADIAIESATGEAGDGSVDKRLFSISRAVESAIRRLRFADKPLKIWVDAICINQDDLAERAQQVRMMAQIYSQASTVHIWLGDGNNDGTGAALRVIRDIYNINRNDGQQCVGGDGCHCLGTKHLATDKDVETNIYLEGSRSFRAMWEVFDLHTARFDASEVEAAGGSGTMHLWFLMENFFEHPWFQRVWVIQEALVARRPLLYHGRDCISWPELVQVNAWLDLPEFTDQTPHLWGRITMPPIWSMLASENKSGGSERQGPTMLQVFLAALAMKASEPRDRLFALLPFGEEIRSADNHNIPPELSPDYEKPQGHVMAAFTRWCIVEQASLAALSYVHCHPARTWVRTLCDRDATNSPSPDPTWAIGTEGTPEWSQATLRESFPSFCAAGTSVPDLSLLQDASSLTDWPLVLRLRGRKIGQITTLGHPPAELVYQNGGSEYSRAGHRTADGDINLGTVFHHIFDPSQRYGYWTRPGESKNGNAPRHPLFWSARYAEHVSAHVSVLEPTRGYDGPSFSIGGSGAMASSSEQGSSLREEDRDEDERSTPTCIDKSFFSTSNGRHGLCPWTARVGDVIAILDGGPVPFLLRPAVQEAGRSEEQLGNCFELVGECYVEGIMYGKVYGLTGEGAEDSMSEVLSLV